MTEAPEPAFIETREYRKFLEFCDACRQYRYIGLCYGPPGVGKTLSALHYTRRDMDYIGNQRHSRRLARSLAKFDTILYTPPVVISPGAIETEIQRQKTYFYDIVFQRITAQNDLRIEIARQRMLKVHDGQKWDFPLFEKHMTKAQTAKKKADRAFYRELGRAKARHDAIPKPTPALIVIDEADRLKVAGLEQVRSIFDRWRIGVVFIGMPGIEKRLARYPQLYSRVGFVHEFRSLGQEDAKRLLRQQGWRPPDVSLPDNALDDDEALGAVLRITGGNFRLLQRLLTQIARVMEINELDQVTLPVVEAARESLVIGTA